MRPFMVETRVADTLLERDSPGHSPTQGTQWHSTSRCLDSYSGRRAVRDGRLAAQNRTHTEQDRGGLTQCLGSWGRARRDAPRTPRTMRGHFPLPNKGFGRARGAHITRAQITILHLPLKGGVMSRGAPEPRTRTSWAERGSGRGRAGGRAGAGAGAGRVAEWARS